MPARQDKISQREGSDADPDAPGSDHVDLVLAQWARAQPDLDMSPVAVIARLGRAVAYTDAAINAGLAEHELSRGSWDVLASLRRVGPPYRLSPTQLYLGLMRTSGAMTHRLGGLERAGLITRVTDPEDGRGLLVEITPEGLELVDRVAPIHLANERAILAALSIEEQHTLAALLRKMLAGFEHEHPAPPTSGKAPNRARRRRRR